MRPDTIIRKSSSWEGLFQRLTFILSLVFLTLPSIAMADVTGKPRVVDGDTIWIGETKIRLHGIDAPEMKQTCKTPKDKQSECGVLSKQFLSDLLSNGEITCKGNERDKYRRLIAVCFAGTKDLNAEMVRQGWGLAYRKYSTNYVTEEADAKAKKLGLWRGQFVAPWEWRRGKRLAVEAPKTCCKICRKGKACGNSCIRRTYTCRKQPGCACNAR